MVKKKSTCSSALINLSQNVSSVFKKVFVPFFGFKMSGISDLIPGSVIDATMFNPCGYSMNGMKTDVSIFFFFQF